MINDSEIDLTEHRDFGEHNSPIFIINNSEAFNSIRNNFKKQIHKDIPWNINSPFENKYKFDGLIALGNKEQRELAINNAYWGTTENIICDCCGKKYIKIPWKKNSGLCENCDKDIYSNAIIPWQF